MNKKKDKEKSKEPSIIKNHIWILGMIITIIILTVLKFFKIDVTVSNEFDSMLDATITFVSIIIGLIGVLISLLISAKEESSMIKYFFEEIDDHFFSRYMSKIVLSGLTVILTTLILYLRDTFPFEEYIFSVWIWLLIYFILKTYFLIDKILQLLIKKKYNLNEKNNNEDYINETQEVLDKFK